MPGPKVFLIQEIDSSCEETFVAFIHRASAEQHLADAKAAAIDWGLDLYEDVPWSAVADNGEWQMCITEVELRP